MSSYYESLSDAELAGQIADLEERVAQVKAQGLKLNMARGKPSPEQLDLSRPMLDVLPADADLVDGGVNCANYGCLEGIPSCRKLFGDILGVPADNVFIGGESSLTLMYDAVSHAMVKGVCGAEPMLLQMQKRPLKWICLVPGYDRHFGIVSQFGFECVCVPLGESGPDMDAVEALVADPDVKGMWCVPKYSNPTGCTYSDEVVERIARLAPAAPDFRVYWDNAYCEHFLYPEGAAPLANVFELSAKAGNPDLVYQFCSTSKITFPGAGVSAMAASDANLVDLKSEYRHRMIGHDKLNQLRHVKFLHDGKGLAEHMAKHAAILRPKFELVNRKLSESLSEIGGCTWSKPRGGYFVSFNAPAGCAKRIVELAKNAGVTMTGAGATWPYKQDPADSNIRIAPSLPPVEELDAALDVFVCCVKLAYAEKLLQD